MPSSSSGKTYPAPDGADRRRWLNRHFDAIAPHYDRIDRVMSAGSGPRYRRERLLAAGLTSGMAALDVGCGTGVVAALAAEIVGPTGRVAAVEPSAKMREEARRRGVDEVVEGTATSVPFPDRSFDLVVMGYALRHVGDLAASFAEFHRVLKPGGRVLLLEISTPPGRVAYAVLKLYLKHVVPAATWLLTRSADSRQLMRYYWDTIDGCVAPSVIVTALTDAQFEDACQRRELAIFAEYTGRKALASPASGP